MGTPAITPYNEAVSLVTSAFGLNSICIWYEFPEKKIERHHIIVTICCGTLNNSSAIRDPDFQYDF